MSLVGFKGQNHPQQLGRRGALVGVDDRETAPEVFGPLHERFRFTLDVAASPHNAKCLRYFTTEDDGLEQSWAGEMVWCNPPYSEIVAWVRKAWSEWETTLGIVMLLPANRTEQRWWQEHVEPFRDRRALTVEFLPGRMRFLPARQPVDGKGDRPPFGCCLLIWRPV